MMIDTNNSVWHEVKAYAETAIDAARARLETPGMSAAETEFERGRIKALRGLLALAEPQLTIPSTDPHYT